MQLVEWILTNLKFEKVSFCYFTQKKVIKNLWYQLFLSASNTQLGDIWI